MNGKVDDLIRRQKAIEAIVDTTAYDRDGIRKRAQEDPFVWIGGIEDALSVVEGLPSAEPEPLTDKEQRIFLAAMGREEKVCKQVDEECGDCCEPYEDSLVSVCREITRKVKGVLWT